MLFEQQIPLSPPAYRQAGFAEGGLRGILHRLFCCCHRSKRWIAVILFCRNHFKIAKNWYWVVWTFDHSSARNGIDILMVFLSYQT